jgi:hypothetical protein
MARNKRLKRLRMEEPEVTAENVWAAAKRGDPTLGREQVSTKKLLTPEKKRARLASAQARLKDSDITLMLNVQIDESEVPLAVTKQAALKWKGQETIIEDKRAGRPLGELARPIKYIVAVNPIVGSAGFWILPDYALHKVTWQVRFIMTVLFFFSRVFCLLSPMHYRILYTAQSPSRDDD